MHGISAPLFATVVLVGGVILFARSFRDLKLRRLIQNTPTARIRSMSMGLVEINGEVVPRSVLTAPFSGRACAYWEVDISTCNRKNEWNVVHRNASGHPFFLRDATGVALVYPHGARFTIHPQSEETCPGIALPDCYARYFEEQHLSMNRLWRLGMLRFRERTLEEGTHVYVLGSATPRSQARDLSDEAAAAATGTDGVNHWASRLQTLTQQSTAVVRQGEHERTFIISQQSERDLAFQLGLRIFGELAVGPALTIFGLGLWLLIIQSGQLVR